MVKRVVFIITLLLLWIATIPAAYAAQFTATVDRNRVSRGENLTLQLNLSGAEAQGNPDISALERDFIVDEGGRTTSTQIINGRISASIGWYLNLVPKQEGRQIIPPVTIDTDAGTLATEPITISVTKAAGTAGRTRGGDSRVSVSAAVNPPDPYKSQPFHYTVKIVARDGGVTGINMEDIHIENAVVDKPDKPKITQEVDNGVRVNIVEFDYIITPLQPGHLIIPPAIIHGNIVGQSLFNPFGGGIDPNDPFGMFGGFSGLGAFGFPQPFTISSEEIDVDIRSAAPGINPWLPLYSLQLKDEWNVEEKAKVGKPITRKIMLLAEGGTSAELPSLEQYQNHDDFKVYADKATLGSDTGTGADRIVGWRSESYTMIPRKPGTLYLPAIKVPWWDITNNKLAYAELAARSLEVLAADGSAVQNAPPMPATSQNGAATKSQQASAGNPAEMTAALPPPEDHTLLYALIAALLAAIGFVSVWAFRLQRRVTKLSAPVKIKGDNSETSESEPVTLDDAATPEDLRKYLQEYGAANWRTPRNAPLEKIFAGAPSTVRKNAKDLVRKLSAAIYAGRDADMDALKAEIQALLTNAKVRKVKRKKIERLPDLNPS